MNIFLFHRDLRIIDNTTLIYQLDEIKNLENNEIVPIFIFPPEQINPKTNEYFSNNCVQFMIETLHELSDDIKKKKGKLYYFKGDTLDILKKINKKVGIDSLGFNLDYTPYARKRDEDIKEWCEENEITCYTKEDYLLHDILNGDTKKADKTPYLVFTPFRNFCMANLKVRETNNFKNFRFTKNSKLEKIKNYLDEEDINNFYENNEFINVHGGRTNGLNIIKSIGNFKDYSKERDNLVYKTTFLGAHLKFGTISIRETYHKSLDKLGKKSGLINEFYWRDFYANITYEFPRVLQGQLKGKNKSYKEEYDNIKWSYNKKLFEKWCNGQTGYPVVDAAMNQMNKTGYMHNRCRMIVASFLTKDLHLDWRMGEKYFASKLIDYDPINNSGGWQWSTGCGTDAQPYFRIFNPWSQTEKFDPDCEYIKKWIPELENVDNNDIINWYKPDVNKKWLEQGINYYKPIINHDEERLETLKLYKSGLN